ncbi:MAG: hypothetical protein JNM84_11040 [Planctomycetes bacterium]|nr:hypothetical protein [Planctomycetota bacterium]
MSASRAAFGVAALLLVVLLLWFGVALFSTEDGAGVAQLSPGSSAEARALDPLVAEAREVHRESTAVVPVAEAPAPETKKPSSDAPRAPRGTAPLPDDLRFRVLDGATREPLEDLELEISWVVEIANSRSSVGIATQRTAGPEREVRVPRAAIEERRKQRGDEGLVLARARGAFAQSVELRVKAEPWPTAVQELVLPAHGWLELEVQDELGRTLAQDGTITLRPAGENAWANSQLVAVQAGVSKKCLCGVGVSLDATGELEDGSKLGPSVLRGPLVAGETRRESLRRVQVGSKLALRVLLAPDEPLRSKSIDVSVEVRRRTGSASMSSNSMSTQKTDAEGWLRLVVEDPKGGEGLQRHYELSYRHAKRGQLAAFFEANDTFAPGETSLGDVLLQAEPLLASGVVLQRGGKPLKGIELKGYPLDANGEEIGMAAPQAKTDAEGRFALHGKRPAARVRIEAEGKGYALPAPVEVPAGASEVAIEMEAASRLIGSVMLPRGMDPRAILVRVEGEARQRRISPRAAIGADGAFAIENLAPQIATVVFSQQSGGELARVSDVNIVAGEENRDPRLQELELCRDWRELALRLLRPEGTALESTNFELSWGSGPMRRGMRTDTEGLVQGWFPPEATRFDLRLAAYRPLSFDWAPQRQELQLRAGIRVVLPLEAPKIEPIARLQVALARSSGARSAQVDVVDGLAELVVPEPGTYEVLPSFVILQDSAMLVNGFQLEQRVHVEVGEGDQQRLPVCRIDEAALRAALKAR